MKKGSIQHHVMMVIYQLIVIALILTGLLYFVTGAVEDTLLEKNYYARDISLLITTLNAAPGNVEYNYVLPDNVDLKIKIKDHRVNVNDGG